MKKTPDNESPQVGACGGCGTELSGSTSSGCMTVKKIKNERIGD